MKIGIIVAMDKEFVQLRKLLDDAATERRNQKDFVTGRMGEKEVVLQKCGIGKVNAAIGTVEMINGYHPDLIISSGCAGGQGEGVKVMDVVVAAECAYHDAYCGDEVEYGQIMGMPASFKAQKELIDKALNMNNKGTLKTRIHSGLTVSGEWFVNEKGKMRDILSHFPTAKAVDMESCAIAQTCYIYKVPFVSFRVISDLPLEDTKASQYFNFWDKVAEDSFEVTKRFIEELGVEK